MTARHVTAAPEVGEYWTTAEWARHARTAESTARYWRSIDYGPKGFRVGRRVLYDAAECRAFLRSLQDAEQGNWRHR